MKPSRMFTAMAVLGFTVASLLAQQPSNPNDSQSEKTAEVRVGTVGKLVTDSTNQTVRLWDDGKPVEQVVEARFSPDGRFITTSMNQTLRVWDVQTGKLLAGPRPAHLGSWRLVSFKYGETSKWTDAPQDQRRIKLITETYFTWVAYEAASGKVQSMAGGKCTAHEGAYTETIEYAGEGMTNYLGKEQSFTIRVEGDRLYQSGQLSDGTKIEEVWQRVK